jgi:D-glycero-alpha-D-manno-heptose-7-phosphate kinase
VSYSGGGTDAMPYCGEYGGCALSSAIDVYVSIALDAVRARVPQIAWRADTVAPVELGGDGPLLLARQILDVMGYRDGVRCEIHCASPFGSGLGSSSALVVALLAAVNKHRGTGLSRHDLARQAFHVEREILGHVGGAHDQFASVYGGTNFYDFYGGSDVRVTPLGCDSTWLAEHLVLCDTALRRKSERIIQRQMARVVDRDAECLQSLHEMKRLTVGMRDALRRGDLVAFGELMSQGWRRKQSLVPGISNLVIDEMYVRGMAAGALGGRVVGAGGGGYLLFVVHPRDRASVVAALTGHGGRVLPFLVSRQGVRVIRQDR